MLDFPYDQHPFDSKSQIRLLKLEPSASGVPQWRFTRRPADIGDIREKYFALSYEWGSSNDAGPFIINGKEVVLRRNLIKLLHALPDLRKKRTAYWIDSICINQNDQQEKTNQILRLRDIYRSATHVLSWLGPMRDGSNLAMKYLSGIDVDGTDSVQALLNRRYWTRVWMVQEVVLGRKWYIACGSDMIEGPRLTRIFDSTELSSTRRGLQWQESKAFNLISERARFEAEGPLPLLDLMLRFYELDSEFKVDRIGALLALSDFATVGYLHELLTRLADCSGDSDRTKVVVRDIGKEMLRLAPPNGYWNEARSKDVAIFMEGVLTGNIGQKGLGFIANRLWCSRMFVEIDPGLTSGRSGKVVVTFSSREKVSSRRKAETTVNWLPSCLAQFGAEMTSSRRRREATSACVLEIFPSRIDHHEEQKKHERTLGRVEEASQPFKKNKDKDSIGDRKKQEALEWAERLATRGVMRRKLRTELAKHNSVAVSKWEDFESREKEKVEVEETFRLALREKIQDLEKEIAKVRAVEQDSTDV
jgi:hypothetical protein